MEPIASPTRPDLLQKINEKKYIVSIPIICCVKLQGNMRLFPLGLPVRFRMQ